MTAPDLPPWAQKITPVDMEGAAYVLGVSKRFLVDVIKKHQHYEKRGNRKVFYPEHVELLRESLKCQTSKSKNETEYGTPLEPSTESAYERALALATASGQKSNAHSLRRASGKGTLTAKKPYAPSKKQQKAT